MTAAAPRPSLPCGAAGPMQEDRGLRGAVTQVGLRRGGEQGRSSGAHPGGDDGCSAGRVAVPDAPCQLRS